MTAIHSLAFVSHFEMNLPRCQHRDIQMQECNGFESLFIIVYIHLIVPYGPCDTTFSFVVEQLYTRGYALVWSGWNALQFDGGPHYLQLD